MAVRTSLEFSRNTLRRLFLQRCCYLFFLLLGLVAFSPFIEGERGVWILNGINAFVILSAAAVVGRTVLSFLIVFCLISGAVGLRFVALDAGQASLFNWSLLLHIAVYITVLGLLLRYVFGPEVMDTDRLWGAAAMYVMIGILWCYFYAFINLGEHSSFTVRGAASQLNLTDLLYFSFSTLTTIGFGDIVPITRPGQVIAIVEGIIGQLFLAILIAKLVGVYPPPTHHAAPQER